jgi:hypothetical protein
MFAIVRLRFGGLVAAALLAMTAAAGAASVDLDYSTYNRGKLAQAQTAIADFKAALPSGKGKGTQNLRNTAVGSFTAFGRTGSGDAVVGSGSKLQVRNDNRMRWGRYNDDGVGGPQPGNWLDSNDNRGIKWRIKDVGKFDTIGFFISDVADVGGKFSMKVGDTVYRDIADGAKLRNGNIHFVRILLSEAVDKLTIRFSHDIANDGFGLDGMVVGRSAPVPLPPAAALLLTGLLGVYGLRRRGARRAA